MKEFFKNLWNAQRLAEDNRILRSDVLRKENKIDELHEDLNEKVRYNLFLKLKLDELVEYNRIKFKPFGRLYDVASEISVDEYTRDTLIRFWFKPLNNYYVVNNLVPKEEIPDLIFEKLAEDIAGAVAEDIKKQLIGGKNAS